MDVATATLEEFTALVGESFSVTLADDDASHEFVLAAAEARGQANEGRRQPFSLVFACEITPALGQSIYRFEHEKTGPLDLFAVPIQQQGERTFYEVVLT